MSGIYGLLAPVYDKLNEEIDYEAWADFTTRMFQTHAKREIKTVLDLACGTGSLTIPLAARGLDMIGLDLSAEMLSVARDRADLAGQKDILWIMQDMTAPELLGSVDAVVCALDGINHLTGKGQLQACFSGVSNYLAPGGVFMFDVNSAYKFEHIYADCVYALESDHSFCVWQNDYRSKSKVCDFYITLFTEQKNGQYRRDDAIQSERFYSELTLRRALLQCGLTPVAVYGDMSGSAVQATDERLYIIAVKPETNPK